MVYDIDLNMCNDSVIALVIAVSYAGAMRFQTQPFYVKHSCVSKTKLLLVKYIYMYIRTYICINKINNEGLYIDSISY